MPASTTPARWTEWREPGPKPPDDIIFLYGASHKAYHILTCNDVHHGPMPDGSDCMCGVCLTSSPRVENSIEASTAPVPTEPEKFDPPREGWWTARPTVYEPDPEGRAGGIGTHPAAEKAKHETRRERRRRGNLAT